MNAHEKSEKQAAEERQAARRAILLLYGLMALFIAVPVVIFLARR